MQPVVEKKKTVRKTDADKYDELIDEVKEMDSAMYKVLIEKFGSILPTKSRHSTKNRGKQRSQNKYHLFQAELRQKFPDIKFTREEVGIKWKEAKNDSTSNWYQKQKVEINIQVLPTGMPVPDENSELDFIVGRQNTSGSKNKIKFDGPTAKKILSALSEESKKEIYDLIVEHRNNGYKVKMLDQFKKFETNEIEDEDDEDEDDEDN